MKITWKEYIETMEEAKKLLSDYEKPEVPSEALYGKTDIIIGIAPGGLILATYLSYQWKIPLVVIYRAEYVGRWRRGKQLFYIDPNFRKLIRFRKVLVVDDVMDTGRTLWKVGKWLEKWKPKFQASVVLFRKREFPQYFCGPREKVNFGTLFSVKQGKGNEWIEFPYNRKDR